MNIKSLRGAVRAQMTVEVTVLTRGQITSMECYRETCGRIAAYAKCLELIAEASEEAEAPSGPDEDLGEVGYSEDYEDDEEEEDDPMALIELFPMPMRPN